MTKKLLVLLALLATLLTIPAAASATTPPTLHYGSTGKRVKNLQWLLSAHDPSHFRSLRTYYGPISGRYRTNTARAVYAMKFRLGYPRAALNKNAGVKLFRILLGKERRPLAWIATASRRQAGLRKHPHRLTSCQQKIVNVATSQLGVHEYNHSNWGGRVTDYLAATGIHYPAPWCVAFAQWVLKTSGYGTIANHSASTGYIRYWAWQRHWLTATPARGDLVLFGDHHTGVVVGYGRYTFTSIEGNYADGVYRVTHRYGEVGMGFVRLTHCPSVGPIATPHRTTDKLAGFAWWQIALSILVSLLLAAFGHWHLRRWLERRALKAIQADLDRQAAEENQPKGPQV